MNNPLHLYHWLPFPIKMLYSLVGLFPEDIDAWELMQASDDYILNESRKHDCFIGPSKFKDAGMGLFCNKGGVIWKCFIKVVMSFPLQNDQ